MKLINSKILGSLAILSSAAILRVSVAAAATLTVSQSPADGADCFTIQACVEMAEMINSNPMGGAVEEIKVYPGTYYESVEIRDLEGIALRSLQGTSVTTIDATGSYFTSLLIVNSPGASIRGFTLRGGEMWWGGAGVHAEFSDGVLIEDCRVTDVLGTGIYIESFGGQSTATVRDSSVVGATGDGMFFFGDGIAVNGGTVVLERNLVANNTGSGIIYQAYDYSGGGSLSVVNCTVANNAIDGIALAPFENPGSVSIHTTIVSSNGAGLSCAGTDTFCADVSLRENDVWNNSLGNYIGNLNPVDDISANPLFCNASAGNYNLHASSPCLSSTLADYIGAFPQGCGGGGGPGNPGLPGPGSSVGLSKISQRHTPSMNLF